MSKLTIEFPSDNARKHFALWLCGSGEQDYWDWMQVRVEYAQCGISESLPATPEDVVQFDYHPTDGRPRNFATFVVDGVITTKTTTENIEETE